MYERVSKVGPQPAELDVRIRGYKPEDKSVILKTWLMGYKAMSIGIPEAIYFQEQQRLIFSIARRSRVAIACDRSMPQFVLGFTVVYPRRPSKGDDEPLVVHWAWTRQNYRQMGILKLMLLALGWHEGMKIHMTHWNHRASDLQRRFKMVRNPYHVMDITREQKIAIAHSEDRV